MDTKGKTEDCLTMPRNDICFIFSLKKRVNYFYST